MEQFYATQKSNPKLSLSSTRRSQYYIGRMNNHVDKVSDRLVSMSAHERNREKFSEKTSVRQVQSQKQSRQGSRPNSKQDTKPEPKIAARKQKSKSDLKSDQKLKSDFKAQQSQNMKNEKNDKADANLNGPVKSKQDNRFDSKDIHDPESMQGKHHKEFQGKEPCQENQIQNSSFKGRSDCEGNKDRQDGKYMRPDLEKKIDLRPDYSRNTMFDGQRDLGKNCGYVNEDHARHPRSASVGSHSVQRGDQGADEAEGDNVSQNPLGHNHDAVTSQDQHSAVSAVTAQPETPLNIAPQTGDVNNLPSTTVVLQTSGGSKVYVVGTVHFSVESQKDVANVIRAVQPDYVVLELCTSRSYLLQWNEEHVLKEAQNLNFKSMRQVLQTAGVVQGGLYLMLLSMTIQITKQLGIAPGGEFRMAYKEATQVPNCVVWFGDRPLQITLQRMLPSLSTWQLIKLAFIVLFKSEKISKEDIENCKDRDVLERMLLKFSEELPEFARVMVDERDSYLTYSLQLAAQGTQPKKVVGVVGIGHLAGIKKRWGQVTLSEVQQITSIPPPRTSSKIIKFTLKFTAVGLVLFGAHKLASKSSFYSNLFRSWFPTLTQD